MYQTSRSLVTSYKTSNTQSITVPNFLKSIVVNKNVLQLIMHTNLQNNIDLPPELCTKPLALIGISGLDTVNNAVHKSIWETFSSNRRVERAPVNFKLISNAHEFPVIKPKRNSYDWYIPKGILKKNWMNKHLYEIPAVIVIFYDLDWTDPLWNEKMIECASRVHSMRAALEGRNTRITVVLIQNTLPLPTGEDALGTERAINLCSSCELNSASLFVLPHGDHLQGYAVRLENAFYEFAQTYYQNDAKNIKSHKEHLNKNSHQYLYVRHQFKMGFLYELKQDIQTAFKHYTHAYNNLLEIRIVDTNALEVRTVAGYINYKLCRLMFNLSLPRDAIVQFKAHIERFRNRMGFHELIFEHYAWLSKQYSVFGEIFDEAVKLGLPAVQTQHPGIYYQQAAQFAILRHKSCQELCSNIIAYPHPDPLEGHIHLEFFGQRPWRPGKVSGEPPDPQLESSGIQALQFLEKQVNHSSIIIALYGLAMSQYKIYRCPRTRRHLALLMADEYYSSKDYGKALMLYTHMLSDFQSEKWWKIISEILQKAIRCAYLTANVQDYILLAIQILSRSVPIDMAEKKRVHENLNRIFKRQIPYGDPNVAHEALQSAIILWQPVFGGEPLNLTFDMVNVATCIETKARFTKVAYEVDQNITVEIFIRSTSPFPITFSRVSVTINAPALTSEFAVSNTDNVSLHFQSNEVKRFVIEFTPDPNDMHKSIQIGGINLAMGNSDNCTVELKFGCTADVNEVCLEFLYFKNCKNQINYENIRPLNSALIVPRYSKLNVRFEHAQPALLGEWYEILVDVTNEEENHIKDLSIEVNLNEEELQNIEFSLKPMGAAQKIPMLLNVPTSLGVKEQMKASFFLRAHKVATKTINIKISYVLDSERPVVSIKSETIILPTVQPFEVNTKYLSMLMKDVSIIYVAEEFCAMPTIHFLSPWPIVIENTSFEFMSPVRSFDQTITSQLAGKIFDKEEIGVEVYLAICDKASEDRVNMGQYTIKWKRKNGKSTTSQTTVLGLPCEWMPLDIKVDAPAHGLVRTPLIVTYKLCNKSQQIIQLDVSMDASEAFMFAGYRQFSVSILPKSVRALKYNLYPLIAGSVALPKLILTNPEGSAGVTIAPNEIEALIQRAVPTHIFVMPQVKGNPVISPAVKPREVRTV